MNYDVFNGDADGICALLQLRLAEPRTAILVTGVKRDIGLLQRVNAQAGDKVTVLDISLDKNRQPLLDLLGKQVDVLYVDHHQASHIPRHPNLQAIINTDADVCTSLLIDEYLEHRFTAWAVAAAFGDNLDDSALRAARRLQLSADQIQQLRQLGISINYNAYGETPDDLHLPPERLYQALSGYESPFDFLTDKADLCWQLTNAYATDMALAGQTQPVHQTDKVAVFILPDAKWARRVSGVLSNALANAYPDRAHAVLTRKKQAEGYVVSVRAPINNRSGADEVCGLFPGGGGRKAAAGINDLNETRLNEFIQCFEKRYKFDL